MSETPDNHNEVVIESKEAGEMTREAAGEIGGKIKGAVQDLSHFYGDYSQFTVSSPDGKAYAFSVSTRAENTGNKVPGDDLNISTVYAQRYIGGVLDRGSVVKFEVSENPAGSPLGLFRVSTSLTEFDPKHPGRDRRKGPLTMAAGVNCHGADCTVFGPGDFMRRNEYFIDQILSPHIDQLKKEEEARAKEGKKYE